jgi:hypothetical protein
MNELLLTYISTPLGQTIAWWTLAVLVIFWIGLRIKNGGRLLAFNTPTGRVLVSRTAIKGLIARTCCGVEGVSHPQSRIRTHGGRLRVRVYIQLRGNTRLGDVSTLLQERLDLALRQNLGIEKIGKIDVIVTDIQPCPNKVSSRTYQRSTPYAWGEGEGQ